MNIENQEMKKWLKSRGIDATPKWLPDGSLKYSWRLYNKKTKWTIELANKLNKLGFLGHDFKPLGLFSGNGGMFSIKLEKAKW